MNSRVQNVLDTVKDKAPEMVKENKGALIGAVVGYFFLSDNEKAKTSLLTAIAGSLVVDKKKNEE